VRLDLALQTYSSGVVSLLNVSSSGLGPGPHSFGSLLPHATFHCVALWFVSGCWPSLVMLRFRNPSRVV
jgi:hypothetical protein